MSRKLVEGVGINDADYVVKKQKDWYDSSGKRRRKLTWQCPYYVTWKGMLSRRYNIKHKESAPTYKGCSVYEDWHIFSNFKSWMETQDWEGKVLDKDLLVEDNKIYSPDTCVFINNSLNNFLVLNDSRRNGLPLGVCFDKARNKYKSGMSWKNKIINLGRFDDVNEAHTEWQKCKLLHAKILYTEQDDDIIRKGLLRLINKLSFHIENNLETKTL